VPTWLAWCSPLAGPVVLIIGAVFFRRMSRYYASPGQ
jgi:hypothetical protein